MINSVKDVRIINLPTDFSENGDLTVMEGSKHVPFSIARVFVVRATEGSIRGLHAHKFCTQFLTCPYGIVEVICDDSDVTTTFKLDNPGVGLLIPPGIWAHQRYVRNNSVLTVLCDRIYEANDYIREYLVFKEYRGIKSIKSS